LLNSYKLYTGGINTISYIKSFDFTFMIDVIVIDLGQTSQEQLHNVHSVD